MKKSFLKSLTFVQVLSMVMTILVLRQNGLSTLTAALRHWVHAILPLSSCSRSTRMFLRGIMCCALVIVCVGCKSVEVVGRSEVQEIQKCRSVDTVVVRDSVLVRDSVVQRERTIHDTVYITKEVYRDRLHSTLNAQHSTLADTIHIVKYRDRVIEHPPEKYVPKFYKWCTIALWAIGLLAIGYWLLKWWLKCRA